MTDPTPATGARHPLCDELGTWGFAPGLQAGMTPDGDVIIATAPEPGRLAVIESVRVPREALEALAGGLLAVAHSLKAGPA